MPIIVYAASLLEFSQLRCEHRPWPRPPSPNQPPAVSHPAPKEQWLALGPVAPRIRSRWYISGACLFAKQLQPDHLREKDGVRKGAKICRHFHSQRFLDATVPSMVRFAPGRWNGM